MASISGAAVTPAAQSAVSPGNLVNVPIGYPAPARWPGPVSSGQYSDSDPGQDYPVEGPLAGDWVFQVGDGSIPADVPGGGVQDTSWTSGTDGPMVPWDSSAGEPFAPSRAVNPDLHGQDTGAVFQNQYVVPAFIGSLKRQTLTGQTFNRTFAFDPVTGEWVPSANGRINYDQRQPWDPSPYDGGGGGSPWDPGYAERPVYNNLAYTASPVTSEQSIYSVSGALPDRAVWNEYEAQSYEAPPDPIVNQPGIPSVDTAGGWLLG